MRVSELDPRVKNKRFFLPFLTLGTSTKLLGFMRVLAILDPLEISSGGCTPGKPVRGRTGQAALSPSARAGGCTPGMPASCVPQGRKGPSFRKAGKVPAKLAARTRASESIKRERQLAAPRRDLTAEALRRGREVSSCTGVSVSSPLQGANWPVRPRTEETA